MKKNIAKLVKKVIVDKNGKKNTVWVKVSTNVDKKKAKSSALVDRYENALKKVNKDLNPNNPDYKQALALKMIMMHGFRVGNEDSAEGFVRHESKKVEKTYGLLTLQPKHIVIKNDESAKIIFRGKKSVLQNIDVKNKSLIEGLKFFKERTKEGEPVLGMTNYELRKYINKTIGAQYSPKDFRTMRANIEAKVKSDEILKRKNLPTNKSEIKKEINEILDHVASQLGNTSKVAKRSYVDDLIIMEHLHNRLKSLKGVKKKK